MAKNILAFFGLAFLTVLIVGGVTALGMIYDTMGFVALPEGMVETPISLLTSPPNLPDTVYLEVEDFGRAEWHNPLEEIPTPTETPQPTPTFIPQPTATPIPPLDPGYYQAETMVRLKTFVGALEGWLDANAKLSADQSLLNNDAWRGEMYGVLDEIGDTSYQLASLGPAPEGFESIDAWYDRINDEMIFLESSYRQGLETGDPASFQSAGNSFTKVKEYLSQVVTEMVDAGWTSE